MFTLRIILTALLGSAILSCSASKPTPPIDSSDAPGAAMNGTTPKRRTHEDPVKLFAAFDKCTKYKYCKALDHLNLYFSSGTRAGNYKTLIKALHEGSPRIQSFALFRLFAYKSELPLVPHLTAALERSTDKKVQKLALTLLFLNGSEAATTYITRKWPEYPKQLKMEVVWVIRKVASHLPMQFIETLTAESLPALRALALEVKVRLTQNVEQLTTCVKAQSSQSAFCALSLARFKESSVPGKVEELFAYFDELSKKSRKRLNAPRQLITTLEKLVIQSRLSEERAFTLAEGVLKNRRLSDKFRASAAHLIGRIGGKRARILLERFRRDRRRRVGYAVRRAIYLMHKKG